MPKRVSNLIEKIASMENLREAYKKTSKNKLSSYGYLEFKEYSELNLLLIREELLNGTYKIGPYRHFTIYEPKQRLISALSFKDRLVQHALCNIIEPMMDKTLLPYTFACRKNLGLHAGVKHIQSLLRKTNCSHFLKLDIKSFFASIPRNIINDLYARKIKCPDTLKLIAEIIPPDDIGIPIGSLTSQISANLIGGILDNYIHHELKCKYWARYMDDVVILGNDPNELRNIFFKIQEFIQLKLNMKISKWFVNSVKQGINFLGFRIWKTHKLLRKGSVIGAKRKIKTSLKNNDNDTLNKFLSSWIGHAKWSDSRNLINNLNKIFINSNKQIYDYHSWLVEKFKPDNNLLITV